MDRLCSLVRRCWLEKCSPFTLCSFLACAMCRFVPVVACNFSSCCV